MLHLADDWLKQGRYAQVLCAQLDSWPDDCRGSWLALAGDGDAGIKALAGLEISAKGTAMTLADAPDLPACLAAALPSLGDGGVSLPGGYRRWPVFRTGRE